MSEHRKKWMSLQIVAFAVSGILVIATGNPWWWLMAGGLAFGRLAYIINE